MENIMFADFKTSCNSIIKMIEECVENLEEEAIPLFEEVYMRINELDDYFHDNDLEVDEFSNRKVYKCAVINYLINHELISKIDDEIWDLGIIAFKMGYSNSEIEECEKEQWKMLDKAIDGIKEDFQFEKLDINDIDKYINILHAMREKLEFLLQ